MDVIDYAYDMLKIEKVVALTELVPHSCFGKHCQSII